MERNKTGGNNIKVYDFSLIGDSLIKNTQKVSLPLPSVSGLPVPHILSVLLKDRKLYNFTAN